MASVTVHRRVPSVVASHAIFHGRGNFSCDAVVLRHGSMATGTINASLSMARVAEEDKILDGVNLVLRKRRGLVSQRRQPLDLRAVLLHRAMARHALAHRRKRRFLPGLHRSVAIPAFDFQRRMPLVAEVNRLFGSRPAAYGNENATSESE